MKICEKLLLSRICKEKKNILPLLKKATLLSSLQIFKGTKNLSYSLRLRSFFKEKRRKKTWVL